MLLPPIALMKKFDLQIQPLMHKILNNLKESISLAKLRDTILPKLMNGEIEV
jgi:type I restriction enzyme S subunit